MSIIFLTPGGREYRYEYEFLKTCIDESIVKLAPYLPRRQLKLGMGFYRHLLKAFPCDKFLLGFLIKQKKNSIYIYFCAPRSVLSPKILNFKQGISRRVLTNS